MSRRILVFPSISFHESGILGIEVDADTEVWIPDSWGLAP